MDTDAADRHLIDQIRAGSETAWRDLIERYHGRLLAFARTRLASLADAEDVVQEACIGFLNSLPTYDHERSLETYLFTILRYKLVDRLRSKKAAPLGTGGEDEDDWWGNLPDPAGESPSRVADAAENARQRARLLADLLRRLIDDYRDRDAFEDLQAIELLFFAGRRNLEVAELLSMDQKAVAGIKFRAVGKLRRFLAESGAAETDWTDEQAEVTVARVWRERRLTCLKRSTLGSYSLGVLDEPWLSYTQFHLDMVACPLCLANLSDLDAEEDDEQGPARRQVFMSSVGFLSQSGSTG